MLEEFHPLALPWGIRLPILPKNTTPKRPTTLQLSLRSKNPLILLKKPCYSESVSKRQNLSEPQVDVCMRIHHEVTADSLYFQAYFHVGLLYQLYF